MKDRLAPSALLRNCPVRNRGPTSFAQGRLHMMILSVFKTMLQRCGIALGLFMLLLVSPIDQYAASLRPPVISPVNQKAPDFAFRSLDGAVHHLSELKGKVVVIDFWGTWCAGCVEEMPTLQRLYERFQSDPKVAFVIVSQDDSPEKVKAFVARNHVALPVFYVGSEPVPQPLAPSAWPSTYFISPTGVVRGEYFGGADWSDESIVRYIDQLKLVQAKGLPNE